MDFTPTVKRKRGPHSNIQHSLLQPTKENPCIGIFTGFSIEITNYEHIKALYESGCFGKGSKSRSCPEFIKQNTLHTNYNDPPNEKLYLDLEEAFFLMHFLKFLQIQDLRGQTLTSRELIEKFTEIKPKFVDCLVAYLYLKAKNWIVKNGTKFGADFLIYKQGLKYYHASFMVIVTRGEGILPRDLKGLQRIAEAADKDVLFLEIIPPVEENDALVSLSQYEVLENVTRRFNYTTFVQEQ